MARTKTEDIPEAEAIETTVVDLTPILSHGSLVTPVAPLAEIEQSFKDYVALCDRLLVPKDYQSIGSKSFRKKSAWRKLAVAFGVSTEILDRVYERDDRGRIIRAEVVMRATAPNGRIMDGLGACDITERCCSVPCGKVNWNGHTCCLEDCNGFVHFSKPGHDLPATAMTRATNRASSDLFGSGEVSAEEVSDRDVPPPPPAPPAVDLVRKAAGEYLHGLSEPVREAMREWKERSGLDGIRFGDLDPAAVVKIVAVSGAFVVQLADDTPAEANDPECVWCNTPIFDPTAVASGNAKGEPYHAECAELERVEMSDTSPSE